MVAGGPLRVGLNLSRDQALVLSAWLDRKMSQKQFADVVDDRAVWSALLQISGTLETSLREVFETEYDDHVGRARERLLLELGDFGL